MQPGTRHEWPQYPSAARGGGHSGSRDIVHPSSLFPCSCRSPMCRGFVLHKHGPGVALHSGNGGLVRESNTLPETVLQGCRRPERTQGREQQAPGGPSQVFGKCCQLTSHHPKVRSEHLLCARHWAWCWDKPGTGQKGTLPWVTVWCGFERDKDPGYCLQAGWGPLSSPGASQGFP